LLPYQKTDFRIFGKPTSRSEEWRVLVNDTLETPIEEG
jgi:hypothetical protein